MSFNWSDLHPITDEVTPPPPLPDPLSSQTLVSKQRESKEMRNPFEISSTTCSQYWNYVTKGFEEDFLMVSLYNDVDSVIQNGPKCGLVALMMSESLVRPSGRDSELNQNDLFLCAKQMGFTKSGEMFSVENMAKLVNRVLSVGSDIKDNLKDRINELVPHLAKGLPILVPYDSDANHEPTLLAGQRAHWAIILGFCIAINTNELSVDQLNGFIDENNSQLIHLKPKYPISDCLLDIISNKRYKRVFVYAKQGKSKHLHLWDFNRLCDSNCNLVKTSRKLNQSDIVLPESGGIIRGLNNKSLFVYK